MKRLLITGLSGRTGRYFLQEIIDNNYREYEIYASIRNDNTDFPSIINKIKVDIDDFSKLNNIMNNFDVVFHIVNIKKSINVVKAALNNNVKWVILVHTTGIYSKYKSAAQEYIEIEKEIENIIKGKDIKITILRPTMIYGSLDDQNMSVFIKMVNKLRIFPVVNGGKYLLQPIYQQDLGKAYYQVLTHKEITMGNSYTLSGKEPIMLIDILKTISKKLDKKTIFISIPYGLAYFGSIILFYVSLTKIDIREKVQRLVEPRAYSHEDASNDFGFNPIPFEEGISKEINLFKTIN